MATFGAAHQGNFYVETNVVLISQNTANNTSVIDIGVWFTGKNGGSVNAMFASDIAINGTQVAANEQQRAIGANGSDMFAYIRRTVTHNADGTLSLVISGTVRAVNIIAFHQTSGGTYTLPTIPRATTPTWSADWFLTGSAKTITLPRASTSFVHDVSYKFGTKTGAIGSPGATTSVSWTPPHTLLTEIPSSPWGTGTITVVTRNGTTVIGSRTVTFNLSPNAIAKPTVNAVTWTDANTTVKNGIGAFLAGLSVISGTFTASGYEGSTITGRRLLLGTNEEPVGLGVPFKLEAAGSVVAKAEATDSRGRITERAADFTVYAYEKPKLGANGWDVRRANASNVATAEGTYLRLDLHVLARSIMVSSTEKNGLTIAVRTRPVNGSWSNRNTITHGVTHSAAIQVSGGAVFALTNSFEVEVTVTDKAGEKLTLKKIVGSAALTLHLNGTNVAIGKYHEQGVLDVAGQIHQSGNKVIDASMNAKNHNSATSGRVYWGTSPTAHATGSTYLGMSNEIDEPTAGNRFWLNVNGTEFLSVSRLGDVRITQRLISPHNAYAVATGGIAIPLLGVDLGTTATITFPAGRFTQPPLVVATPENGRVTLAIQSRTATSCNISGSNWSNSAAPAHTATWVAIQMSASAAAG